MHPILIEDCYSIQLNYTRLCFILMPQNESNVPNKSQNLVHYRYAMRQYQVSIKQLELQDSNLRIIIISDASEPLD